MADILLRATQDTFDKASQGLEALSTGLAQQNFFNGVLQFGKGPNNSAQSSAWNEQDQPTVSGWSALKREQNESSEIPNQTPRLTRRRSSLLAGMVSGMTLRERRRSSIISADTEGTVRERRNSTRQLDALSTSATPRGIGKKPAYRSITRRGNGARSRSISPEPSEPEPSLPTTPTRSALRNSAGDLRKQANTRSSRQVSFGNTEETAIPMTRTRSGGKRVSQSRRYETDEGDWDPDQYASTPRYQASDESRRLYLT
eukprot:CAMPEP_0177701834 /NCGR_PEP_ID=MMETSP0484_2-20121128/6818_1 /TAXON_ID=354590 /ORGANISM="Rhodomonas lens, Strain RHODO" /LENGTH=257 /DNA_ID=CAMNT_0019213085 /DNA_START=9 /DNA_END=782 /DNA_ORIENTATION=-